MIRLYWFPGTRAMWVRWLLEELGESYSLERVDVPKGENRRPEYLAVHPLGAVPAIVVDDKPIIETPAICMYLADRFSEAGLAPPPGAPERADWYQWIVYAACTLEPLVGPIYIRGYSVPAERRREDTARPEEHEKLARLLAPVADAIAERPFVLGEKFSAADVILGGVLDWAEKVGLIGTEGVLGDYLTRMRTRAAFERASASS
jgi:glutathione S-transferase